MASREEISPKNRKKQWLLAGGVALLLLLSVAVVRVLVPGGSSGGEKAGPEGGALSRATGALSSNEEFAASLRHGQIYENDGAYLLGPEFIDIFNAFRAQYIEQGMDVLLKAFAEWAEAGYSPEVARLVYGVFKKYLHYLERLSDPALFPAGASMDQKYAIIHALRNEIFGEKISALLFRFEDERVMFAMSLQAIRTDPSLSEEEKQKKIDELKNSLDDEARERLFPTDPHQEYREKLEQIQKETADLPPEEQAARIRELRMSMFGPEATQRLEDLDRLREERTARQDVYEQEKQKILANEQLSGEEKERQIELLQQDVLLPEQQRRIQALEKLEKLTSGDLAEQIRKVQEGEAEAPDWDNPVQQGANIPAPEGQ